MPGLLFGSRVQGALEAAGHEVELVGDEAAIRTRLADPAAATEVLVVDLTDHELDGPGALERLRGWLGERGSGPGPRSLGFYSHVDLAARERAERAGFDLVVPRSRMAREGAVVVARLVGAGAPAGE